MFTRRLSTVSSGNKYLTLPQHLYSTSKYQDYGINRNQSIGALAYLDYEMAQVEIKESVVPWTLRVFFAFLSICMYIFQGTCLN